MSDGTRATADLGSDRRTRLPGAVRRASPGGGHAGACRGLLRVLVLRGLLRASGDECADAGVRGLLAAGARVTDRLGISS